MEHNFFSGLITALITPFKNQLIDFYSLEKLINRQIKAGVQALVIAGSTGEASTLNDEEYEELLKQSIAIADGKIKIISGISANNLPKAFDLMNISEAVSVDGLMCVTPYYNKPKPSGMQEYFRQIASQTNLPIMLYTVPSRTGINLDDETIIDLSQVQNIVALKDASGDLNRPLRLRSALPSDFSLLCGEDDLALAFNAHGGNGCVSAVSNIAPELCLQVQQLSLNNNYHEAFKIHSKLHKLYSALFLESNPTAIKFAAFLLGLNSDELRLPLNVLSPEHHLTVKDVILELGLING